MFWVGYLSLLILKYKIRSNMTKASLSDKPIPPAIQKRASNTPSCILATQSVSLISTLSPHSEIAELTSQGNLIGPQTFRANQAPAYTGGFVSMLICYCICIGLMGTYWILAAVLNAKRETIASSTLPSAMTTRPIPTTNLSNNNNNYASDVDSISEYAFADLTDFEQLDFRYTT